MPQPALFDGCARIGRRTSARPEWISRPDELAAEYDYFGISAGVVHHVDALGPEPQSGNRLLLEQIAEHPSLVPQWVVLPHGDGRMPPAQDLVAEMLRIGVRAARICPRTHGFALTEDVAGPLLSALQEHRIPLFADVGEMGIDPASDLCARHPDLPFVLCGVPWGSDRELLPALDRCPNLHVETHALYGHRAFERIAAQFGARRLVFGTGLPEWNPGAAMMMPLYEALSDEDRAAVTGGNLLRLLGQVRPGAHSILPALKARGPRDDDDEIVTSLREGRPLVDELIFDVHGHIGHEESMGTAEWCVPLCDADRLVATMDRLGIDRALVSPFAGLMMGDRAANDVTLRALARHPTRLLGYGCVNPCCPDVMQQEIRRLFRGGLVSGYKPYPPRHLVPILDARHRPALEWCDRRRLPMLCHGWLGGPTYVTPDDLDVLAPMYPGAHFVATHVGGSWDFAEALIPVIRRHPNVYADPAYPVTPCGIIEYLMQMAGADRVLYGSDALLIDPASQIGWIGWARIPVEDKRKILGLNLARLLGIPVGEGRGGSPEN